MAALLLTVEKEIFGACGVVIAVILARRRRRRRNRKIWVRDWISKRVQLGAYHQLVQELRLCDPQSYHHFF